jgi:hypothetical protein
MQQIAFALTKKVASIMVRIRMNLRPFAENVRAVSAVEFALLLPFLVASFLLMVAFGELVHGHIQAAQVLEAGGKAAAQDPGSDAVLSIMGEVAKTKGMTPRFYEGGSIPSGHISLTANRACQCPGVAVTVECGAKCDLDRPPVVFYSLFVSLRPNINIDTLIPTTIFNNFYIHSNDYAGFVNLSNATQRKVVYIR